MGRVVELGSGLYAHASGALWAPERKAALVADAQLGHGWSQRRRGEPGLIAGGGISERLDDLLRELNPNTLVFTGDTVHARHPGPGESEEIASALHHVADQAEIILVRGNQDPDFDRDFGSPRWQIVVEWRGAGLRVVDGGQSIEPGDATVIAGHLHPSVRLLDSQGRTETAPALLKGRSGMVLPAFSLVGAGYDISSRKLPAKWRRLLGSEEIECFATSRSHVAALGRMILSFRSEETE